MAMVNVVVFMCKHALTLLVVSWFIFTVRAVVIDCIVFSEIFSDSTITH